LCSLRFIENKENILFYVTSGVVKTHFATAIGVEATSKRYLTYFIACHDLIQNLRKAYDENLFLKVSIAFQKKLIVQLIS